MSEIREKVRSKVQNGSRFNEMTQKGCERAVMALGISLKGLKIGEIQFRFLFSPRAFSTKCPSFKMSHFHNQMSQFGNRKGTEIETFQFWGVSKETTYAIT